MVARDARAVPRPGRRELRLLAARARTRCAGSTKKRLLRKAVEPLLPRAVVHGRKRGFSIPAAAWLRGELEPFARETLAPETLRRQGYLRPEAVTAVLDRHVRGREDLSRQLWGLLAFTLWYERHVEGVTRATSARAGARRVERHVRTAPGSRAVSFRVPTSRPIAVEASAEGVTRVCQFVREECGA